jgi:flagellar basal body-associated protein FliL
MAKKPVKPPENTEEDVTTSKKPSMKLAFVIAIAMSLIGVGAGFGLSFYTFTSATKTDEVAEAAQAEHGDTSKSDSHEEASADKSDGHKTDDTGSDAEKDNHGESAKPEGDHGEETAPAGHGEAADGEEAAPSSGHGETGDAATAGPSTISLDPVVTNISKPSDVWVRLEAVLKATKPLPHDVADQIHQDYMSFFHTLRLEDLEGGSSYNDLKAELLARANTRAEGQVEAIFFKTFLFE